MKMHQFKINLPDAPHREIPTIEMDGEPLKGVTGLHFKASANGYPNVVIEFDCAATLDTVSALIAKVDMNDSNDVNTLALCYDTAKDVVELEMVEEGDELGASPYHKAQFIKYLLEACLEEL